MNVLYQNKRTQSRKQKKDIRSLASRFHSSDHSLGSSSINRYISSRSQTKLNFGVQHNDPSTRPQSGIQLQSSTILREKELSGESIEIPMVKRRLNLKGKNW